MFLIFQALSVEKRAEIIRLLSAQRLCVGALSHLLKISPGAVSQHLRILRSAGLVKSTRCGYFLHYELASGARKRCRDAMNSLFTTKTNQKEKGGVKCVATIKNARSRKR